MPHFATGAAPEGRLEGMPIDRPDVGAGQIGSHITAGANQAERLHQAVDALEVRLAPVLRPNDTKAELRELERPGGSPLAMNLALNNTGVASAIDRLDALADQLDL